MENIQLNITPNEQGEMMLRIGEALKVYDPVKVEITGNIDTPANWLRKKVTMFNQLLCNVFVNIEARRITLTINEKNKFSSIISGVIELHPYFTKWGINSPEKTFSSHELAQAVKMNRFMFADKETAMKLVAVFHNFKAKVEKEIELSDDKRGNRTNLQRQVISTMSIPLSFKLNVPIFKGQPAIEIPVEIEINADTMQCSLFSPIANDLINTQAELMINEQLIVINDIAPDIAIING